MCAVFRRVQRETRPARTVESFQEVAGILKHIVIINEIRQERKSMMAHCGGAAGRRTMASHGFFSFFDRLFSIHHRNRARTALAVGHVIF
jgi:hypothetical protein